MVGFIENGLCVVAVVLESSVKDRIVSRQKRRLVSPVKVDSVGVEERPVSEEHYVHVDWRHQRENKKRARPKELVDWS